MGDDDVSTPREMGHFFLAVDPARFAGLDVFVASMARYLDALRAVPGRPGNILSRPATESGWLKRSVLPADFQSTRTPPSFRSAHLLHRSENNPSNLSPPASGENPTAPTGLKHLLLFHGLEPQ